LPDFAIMNVIERGSHARVTIQHVDRDWSNGADGAGLYRLEKGVRVSNVVLLLGERQPQLPDELGHVAHAPTFGDALLALLSGDVLHHVPRGVSVLGSR